MKGFSLYLLGVMMVSCAPSPSFSWFLPDHEGFRYTGRFLDQGTQKQFAWSASQISFRFTGDSICLHLSARMTDSTDKSDEYSLILDKEGSLVSVSSDSIWFRDLGPGEHEVSILKRTEANVSMGIWEGVSGGPDLRLFPADPARTYAMEVIGNSITCGYGIEGDSKSCRFSPETQDATRTYAFLAAEALGMDYHAVCFSGKGVWRNYGKDTVELMPELWHRYMPQLDAAYEHSQSRTHILINLGTNDFAHQIPPKEAFCEKYAQLVREVRRAHPSARIVMLTGSMMQGRPLAVLKSYLEAVKLELEEEGTEGLYRFDLSPQGDLGYGCDWHPNLAQHQKNAQELIEFLSSI